MAQKETRVKRVSCFKTVLSSFRRIFRLIILGIISLELFYWMAILNG